MIVRVCGDKVVREAVRLSADDARYVGDKLVVIWSGRLGEH
jgi:hypothetical protein